MLSYNERQLVPSFTVLYARSEQWKTLLEPNPYCAKARLVGGRIVQTKGCRRECDVMVVCNIGRAVELAIPVLDLSTSITLGMFAYIPIETFLCWSK